MSDKLNPAQREAVHTLRGPLLVLAGAGTGKTRVVTHRIAELIRNGTAAERILAVTFTNKAAAEMQQRTGALLGRQQKKRPEISTFHSLCVRVLRRQINHLGYPSGFAIYDRGDQESVARGVLREIRAPAESLRPGDLLYFISRWKTATVRPPQAAQTAATDKEHLAAVGYRRYQQTLKAAAALDFDDLLLLTEELFERFAEVRRAEAGRFDHVLIDEYQDTNGSQYRVVRALAEGHRNLCVVGDDDQSIYGWRGAEVAHILRFQRDWPEAKVVRLEENYRSTAEILTMANRLIANNLKRHPKQLRPARPAGPPPRILQCNDEEDEAKQVVASIRARLAEPGLEPRHFAILSRTNEQCRPLEMELRKTSTPYVVVGGMSFFDRKEVRDVLAYLKVLAAPADEVALLRIINTPPRGIGQASITALVEHAVRAGRPLWEVLNDIARCRDPNVDCRERPPWRSVSGTNAAHPERHGGRSLQDTPGIVRGTSAAIPPEVRLNAATAEAIRRFQALVTDYRQRLKSARGGLLDIVKDLLQQIGYKQELERLYKNPNEQQSRWAAVEEVINSLGRYQQRVAKPNLREFLDESTLDDREADDKESQLARNAVVLMTLHSAKGLEFPEVYMIGLEEELLPHKRSISDGGAAIEEERRLCYVGVTRAQERLTMSLALSRMKWGKSRPTQPSRFLYELTGQERPRKRPASRPGSPKVLKRQRS